MLVYPIQSFLSPEISQSSLDKLLLFTVAFLKIAFLQFRPEIRPHLVWFEIVDQVKDVQVAKYNPKLETYFADDSCC